MTPADGSPQPATLVVARNPFDLSELECFPLEAGGTLSDLAARHGVDPSLAPVVAQLDGSYVLQRDWPATIVKPGSVAIFRSLPTGNSGNVLNAVLSIAVLIAAVAVAGPLAGFLTGATSGLLFTGVSAVISATIAIGGSLLVNALVPPQAANLAGTAASPTSASPTYSIQGRGNAARLGSPIPVLYGRHIIYPNYAATPWSDYVNNQQYLHQIFVVGEGQYSIESIRIGTADVSSFQEITTQIVPPGGTVTLFSTGVYSAPEVTGQTLRGTNEVGASTIGPFPACPPDGTISQVALDIGFPRGIYDSSANTGTLSSRSVSWLVQAQRIDSTGTPIGSWVTLNTETYSNADPTPWRITYTYTLPSAGRWKVQATRTTATVLITSGVATGRVDTRYEDQVVWGGLKGYVAAPATFGNLTVIAMTARATDNLGQANSSQVNVVCTRMLPTWNGAAWTAPSATRSIAWALADIMRNTVYGAALPDQRIDVAGLVALDATWSARGDTFDAVFDNAVTIWDALTKTAGCGRARPYYQGGKVRFFRDQPRTLPVALFSPANIVQDTFSMDFILPAGTDTADGVEVEYFNQSTWLPVTIQTGVNGATPLNPAKVQLFGVVQTAQAQREAAYQAAANQYRRAFITFSTELDGMIPSLGDLILVAHDLPRWGQSGRVGAWDAPSLTVTLDADLVTPVTAGTTTSVIFRASNGGVTSPVIVSAGPNANQIVLAALPVLANGGGVFAFALDGSRETTHYSIGTATTGAKRALVVGIVPRGTQVEIRAVIEDDRVHVN